jgi:hypothetical protein
VFESDATNLVAGDSNGTTDVFLYDRQLVETRLISISPTGQRGNGPSSAPVISGDGRFVVFESSASTLVPGDENGVKDIFLFDRMTSLIQLVSIGRNNVPANGSSHNPDVDKAGRYIVFQSAASNLIFDDSNGADDVFVFDRVTGNMIQASSGASDGSRPAISGDGRIITYTSSNDDLLVYHRVVATTTKIGESTARATISMTGGKIAFISNESVILHDRITSSSAPVKDVPTGLSGLEISDDGKVLLLAGKNQLVLAFEDERRELHDGPVGAGFDLSAEGLVAVFDANIGGMQQVLIDAQEPPVDSFHLAGRVTDQLGQPLALVRINDGLGGSTRSDADGYFYLSGYPAGPLTLTPEKEGFEFDPQVWNLSVFRDVAGYLFVGSPEEKLLEEARKDIGMPYNFNRGCEDPYIGCGKAFHGFEAGFCTDLVLDAYTFGINYDINYALQQDAYANPEHFYRWRDARNTHDMWRYFYYSGQLLDHEQDYLPGDAVFFDWSGDGEIDHVALVSRVVNGRPTRMIDATGETEQNPSGLAAELDWLSFHESTVRGHARWSGVYEPVRSGYPGGVKVLQVALSGGQLFMRILDDHGQAVSLGELDIPGAAYFDLDWEEVISVLDPGGRYTIEIRTVGESLTPYIFTFQTLSDGRITGRSETKGSVAPGEVVRIEWLVGEDNEGTLYLKTDSGLRHARIKRELRKP